MRRGITPSFGFLGPVDKMSILTIGLALTAGCLCVPSVLLLAEVLASFRASGNPAIPVAAPAPRTAVVVPAHDESTGIIPTLRDLRIQRRAGDRLIVVADNCSDDTAAAARACGAEVIERNDLTRKGKGYALGFAIDHLSADPPDLVLFVDADCRVPADIVERLSAACMHIGRPLQAYYQMKRSARAEADPGLAELAWMLKNLVRPLGLKNMNCPVQLMGTGMIFPWQDVRSANLSSDHLVEDMKLGLDLAAARRAPRFFPAVEISSEFPVSDNGAQRQRQRWVRGHLSLIRAAPGLVLKAIFTRNLDLLVMSLDLMIPPLTLLLALTVAAVAVGLLDALIGRSILPMVIASLSSVMLLGAIGLAWYGYARDTVPLRKILRMAPAVLARLRLLAEILGRRDAREWVRAERERPNELD